MIHNNHAVPMPCSDHVALQATSQGKGTALRLNAMTLSPAGTKCR